MAKIQGQPSVALHVTLQLSEPEAAALDALAGYGTEPFLKVFYEHMGKSYLQPHEAGLISLFAAAGHLLPPLLNRARVAREAFHK